ncbi:MAG TPA: cupin domain-containing protein [Acidimicrobiales bacterium]|nr:cupin domain-containing protein [Acidimicrobiales bacterium]
MQVYRFDEAEWHVPMAEGTDPDAAADAGRKGARRRFLAQGDSGFYAQVVEMPPQFEAPAHSHSHAEVFMVLEGSCTFNGEELRANDMTVVPAGAAYGFTAGPDGLRFLVVRTGAASYAGA